MSKASEAAEAAGPKPTPGQPAVRVYAATAEDDARIRDVILAELDRRYVKPVARNALELLIAPLIEAAPGTPGYRIVDRSGEERLRVPERQSSAKTGKAQSRWYRPGKAASAAPEPELVASVPMTLEELVEEFQAKHADLFGTPPEPEPEPVKEPELAAPSLQDTIQESVHDTLVHAREAGARFVETQSERAKSLAASSAERSRALASAAGETVEGWRSQIDDRLKAYRDKPGETAGKPGALARLRERFASRTAPETGAAASSPEQSEARTAIDDDHRPSRLAVMGLGAAAAVAMVVAGVVMVRQGADTPAPSASPPQQEAAAKPPPAEKAVPETPPPVEQQAANPPQQQDTAQVPNAQPLPPDVDAEAQPDEPVASDPTELKGVPEVVDTATLRIGGKIVKLFGVEWTRGGQSEELKKYLAGRQITCKPAPASSAHTCLVNRRDLSEVVLFNGGGRASPEATPDLIAAEDRARTERLGIWKR